MTEDDGLHAALCDVRKAYRLIWLYQRRVLDIAKVVSEEFGQHEFRWWSPQYFDPPGQRTVNPMSKWAADFLPLYDFSLLSLPQENGGVQKLGEWMLEITFSADDGYKEGEKNEPDPVTFAAPEKCGSQMGLYAWACTKTKKQNWFWDVWNELDWPEKDVREYADEGIRVVGRRTSLANLPDKDAVLGEVEVFKTLCRKKLGGAFRV